MAMVDENAKTSRIGNAILWMKTLRIKKDLVRRANTGKWGCLSQLAKGEEIVQSAVIDNKAAGVAADKLRERTQTWPGWGTISDDRRPPEAL